MALPAHGKYKFPDNGQPTGSRPYGANLNILHMQGTGRGYSNVQFFAGAVGVDGVDDTDDNSFYAPQTTGVNGGGYARRDNQGVWQVFGKATLNLPGKIVYSANYNGQGLGVYVTTGFDNNGDGDLNDRPPLCARAHCSAPSSERVTLRL